MKRSIKSVGVAVILATASSALIGCAGDRYTQSTGEHIDDTATTARVKKALGGDSMYKYPNVKVTTFKGTVQLSGFVDAPGQKDRATEIAQHVNGVRDVQNNISLKQ